MAAELAAKVKDNEHNENNRFEAAAELNGIIDGGGKPGPYWGCPKIKAKKLLCTRSPGFHTKPPIKFNCEDCEL